MTEGEKAPIASKRFQNAKKGVLCSVWGNFNWGRWAGKQMEIRNLQHLGIVGEGRGHSFSVYCVSPETIKGKILPFLASLTAAITSHLSAFSSSSPKVNSSCWVELPTYWKISALVSQGSCRRSTGRKAERNCTNQPDLQWAQHWVNHVCMTPGSNLKTCERLQRIEPTKMNASSRSLVQRFKPVQEYQ